MIMSELFRPLAQCFFAVDLVYDRHHAPRNYPAFLNQVMPKGSTKHNEIL